MLAVLVGLVGFVAGTLLQKGIGADMDLRTGTAVQMIAGTATTVPLALLSGGVSIPPSAQALGATLWLAVVNSIGGFTLLLVLLRTRSGRGATSLLFVVPAVTALVAVPVLHQPVQPGAFGGLALAGLGVWLVTRLAHGQQRAVGERAPAAARAVCEVR